MPSSIWKSVLRCPAAPLMLCLLSPVAAHADPIIVNITAVDAIDLNPLDGVCDIDILTPGPQCTLRAAVMTANASNQAETIVLPAGQTITLTRSGAGGAEFGDLDLTGDVTILGYIGDPPASQTDLPVIEAAALNDRIFSIYPLVGPPNEVTLRGLILRGGSAPTGGGAILNGGDLQIEHSVLAENSAQFGGAICNNGQLLVVDSHLERNTAQDTGAAIEVLFGSLEVRRSSFRDNRGTGLAGTTISVSDDAGSVSITDTILDGTAIGPPIAGITAGYGVTATAPSSLVIRNSTLSGFEINALRLSNLQAGNRIRVANSVLAGGTDSCFAEGAGMAMADVVIRNSLVQSNQDCAPFFEQVTQNALPELGSFSQNPGSVNQFRAPSGAFSNLVDRGIDPAETPPEPEFGCTTTDLSGNPRPQDGNGDDIARCDLGATEEGPPPILVVDYAGEDLVDDVPGNGVCDITTLVPGATCTLRAAVMEANAMPGLQRIGFADGLGPIVLDRPAAFDASGGDLDITDSVFIEGMLGNGRPLILIEQATANERLFEVTSPSDELSILRNLQLTGGRSLVDGGGAIRVAQQSTLLLDSSALIGNSSSLLGGAIRVDDAAMGIVNSDLSGNQADAGGAALAVTGPDSFVRVAQSSLSGNIDAGFGVGGILSAAFVGNQGALDVVGSTVASNSGGIHALAARRLVVGQSTIVDNLQSGLDVLVDFGSAQNLTLIANVIAGNAASDCVIAGLEFLDVFVAEYQFSGDGSCALGSATAMQGDPMLMPLVRPDGRLTSVRVPVYNPSAGEISPLLDVYPEAVCMPEDQHGQARPEDLAEVVDLDGSCDLGAIEVVYRDLLFSDRYEG